MIGCRTGTLRLYDVPEFGILDIDFSNGELQAMKLGNQIITDTDIVVAKLSEVVQSREGMFEYRMHAVDLVERSQPVLINRLVIALVYYVDEQLKKRTSLSPEHWYMLGPTQSEIWMEPELKAFLQAAEPYLVPGVHAEELAQWLKVDLTKTLENLYSLLQLGLIKEVDNAEHARAAALLEQIASKNSEFEMAVQVSDLIRRTGSLLKLLRSPSQGS
jgi:hypothetical protein